MNALLELDIAEPATGTDLCDWLRAQLMEHRSRTDQPLPARLIYVGPGFRGDVAETDFFEQVENITDPTAQKRLIVRGVPEMVRNFMHFSHVANLVIPGLREMTPVEQANLRHYYKKLYRKA